MALHSRVLIRHRWAVHGRAFSCMVTVARPRQRASLGPERVRYRNIPMMFIVTRGRQSVGACPLLWKTLSLMAACSGIYIVLLYDRQLMYAIPQRFWEREILLQ